MTDQELKEGDYVKVNTPSRTTLHEGKVGKIIRYHEESNLLYVKLQTGFKTHFTPSQLTKISEEEYAAHKL